MSFTELPEEYWPDNFQFPERIPVDTIAFEQASQDMDGKEHHYLTGAPLMYIFADARHVEFTDAYSGQSLFPPEMLMIPVFKALAKSKGPFVVGAQYGFTEPAGRFPRVCQAQKNETCSRRFFATFELVSCLGFSSEYEFNHSLKLRLARKMGIHLYNDNIGITSTRTYSFAMRRYAVTQVLVSRTEHIYYIPEASDENE